MHESLRYAMGQSWQFTHYDVTNSKCHTSFSASCWFSNPEKCVHTLLELSLSLQSSLLKCGNVTQVPCQLFGNQSCSSFREIVAIQECSYIP